MLNLSILGASGRMGKELIALVQDNSKFNLLQAIIAPHNACLGKDSGKYFFHQNNRVLFTSSLDEKLLPRCLIDFSVGSSHEAHLKWAVEHSVPFLIGTTALSETFEESLNQASKKIAILQDCNFSLGINLMKKMLKDFSECLSQDFDIEIVEKHHKEKKDVPSGAALSFANIIQKSSNYSKHLKIGRCAQDKQRKDNEVGIHSIRGGKIAGEHNIMFINDLEKIEISHQALHRSCFAKGALEAALFLSKQGPGRYSMLDCLNHSSSSLTTQPN